jgi:hypothetical protein
MAREILGHIDCPHCGMSGGMRITLDKSGAPFGYCEGDCSGQMRVGGNAARIAKFYAKHPHLKTSSLNVPSTQEDKKPEPAPAPKAEKPAPKKAAQPAPPAPSAPRKLSIFEQLAGVTHG